MCFKGIKRQTVKNGRMETDKIASTYRKKNFWIIAGITLVILLLVLIIKKESLYGIVVFNSVFALFLSSTYIQIWKFIAKQFPARLSHFYLAASAIRLLLTFIVAVIGIMLLAKVKFELISFLLILSVYYISILAVSYTHLTLPTKRIV